MTNAISSTSVNGVIDDELIKAFQDEAKRAIAEVVGEKPAANITTLTIEGIPQYEIRNVARNKKANMIIMGTHGRTGLKHLFMGSVAEYVIRHSAIPVLVIPDAQAE
jgi:nucleotide-binding universal stress UspA family protein